MRFGDGAVEGDLRDFAFGSYSCDQIPEGRIGWIGDAVLDGGIEPTEPFFSISEFCQQCCQAY